MGQVIPVETTDGPKQLDLAEASRMVVMVGGIEYTIVPPHIAPLLKSFTAMDAFAEQSRQRMANADRLAAESSRRTMDRMNPPASDQ